MELDIGGVLVSDRADNIIVYNPATSYATVVSVNGKDVWVRNTSPTTPPDAPSNFIASDCTIGGPSVVNMSWQSFSSGVEFTIYRDDLVLDTTRSLGYVDSTAVSDQVYTYKVNAIYLEYPELGNSLFSDVDTGCAGDGIVGPPSALPSCSASDGTSLTYTEILYSAGDKLTESYKIYRNGIHILNSAALSAFDLSGDPGVTYFYSVSCVNLNGEGDQCPPDSGYRGEYVPPDPDPEPDPIMNLDATDDLTGEIILTWTVQANTNYVVIREDDIVIAVDANSPLTLTPRSGTYYYRAQSLNDEGETYSNPDTGTALVANTVPSVPLNFVASTNKIDLITFDWTLPSDQGTPTCSYEIYDDGDLLYELPSGTTHKDFDVTGLYTSQFRIVGVNSAGYGPYSDFETGTSLPVYSGPSSPIYIDATTNLVSGTDFPADIDLTICMCGGGGSGGEDGQHVGGGRAGEKIQNQIVNVPSGIGVYATIGAGGYANGTYPGAPGGATSFGTYLTANGGAGGTSDGNGGSVDYQGLGASFTGCGGTYTDGGVSGVIGGGGEAGLFGDGVQPDNTGIAWGEIGAGGGCNTAHNTAGNGGMGRIMISW